MSRALKINLAKQSLFTIVTITIFLLSFPISISHADTTYRGRGTFEPGGAFTPGSELVHIGIEPSEVYGIDIAQGTWCSNFQMWWRWYGNLDPSTTTYFTNNADAKFTQSIKYAFNNSKGIPEPILLTDGDRYQSAYFRMCFNEDFKLERFPLDRQKLNIKIQNDTYDSTRVVYVFDYDHLSPEQKVPTSGWVSKGIKTDLLLHRYATDFGNTDDGQAIKNFSNLIYTMEIERPKLHFYLKLFFPLIVILISTFSALIIRQVASKAPLAITSTGLLTVIFSQQTYSQELPAHAPAVLIDKIYIVGLLTVLAAFVRVAIRTRSKQVSSEINDEKHLYMGRRSDNIFSVLLLALFGLVTALLILKP
jgi:hypothetical protein